MTVLTSSSHRAGQGVSQDHFGSLIHHMVLLEITLGSHFRLRSHFSENSVDVLAIGTVCMVAQARTVLSLSLFFFFKTSPIFCSCGSKLKVRNSVTKPTA